MWVFRKFLKLWFFFSVFFYILFVLVFFVMVKIIAIGGGENGRMGTLYETGSIDEEIVFFSGKKNPKLLFIPPPSKFDESYFEVMRGVFVKLGCSVSVFYLRENNLSKVEIENLFLGSDIIYVGGGNTLSMMRYWRKYGIDGVLMKAAKKDIVLAGLSAGGICWFDFGCSDSRKFSNPDADLIKVRGLGLIPALFCPHYDVELDRKGALKDLMKKTKGVGLAFDNCSAIQIKDGCYRIITSKKSANAYKVYWKNKTYFEEVINKNKEFDPLDDLLIK